MKILFSLISLKKQRSISYIFLLLRFVLFSDLVIATYRMDGLDWCFSKQRKFAGDRWSKQEYQDIWQTRRKNCQNLWGNSWWWDLWICLINSLSDLIRIDLFIIILGLIHCVRWNLSGDMLASISTDQKCKLLDFKTGKVLYTGTNSGGCELLYCNIQ